jgi:hypothetical protein
MDTTQIVILVAVVAVLLLIAALVFWTMRKRRRQEELRQRFGSEYDRSVERSGRRSGEAHLQELARRRDSLHITMLSAEARARYQGQWDGVQPRFVDDPVATVNEASGLLDKVMRERGYPVEDFDAKEDLVAADHPDVAERYRAARDIQRRAGAEGAEQATTEELRTAFVHYRALFAELLGDPDQKPGASQIDLRGMRAEDRQES